jgi:hypothetical protein
MVSSNLCFKLQNATKNFRSSENEFKVFSTVPFATKVFRRLLLPRCCRQKLEIRTGKNFQLGLDFKVFFSLDPKLVVLALDESFTKI